jgi:hypothetical protein
MNKKPLDIDPRTIAVEFFRKLGGMEGMTKWGKTHRSLAYQLIAKLMAQPLVQTNVNVAVVDRDDNAARRKLEDAFLRLIDARKYEGVDPAVYVNNERLIEGRIEPDAPGSNADNLKSPNSGSPFHGPRVDASTAEGKKNQSVYSKPTGPLSTVPGLAAGAAVGEGADDKLSTTERFYLYHNRGGRMP